MLTITTIAAGNETDFAARKSKLALGRIASKLPVVFSIHLQYLPT